MLAVCLVIIGCTAVLVAVINHATREFYRLIERLAAEEPASRLRRSA
jgi:ribosomal silencing factor RsfS